MSTATPNGFVKDAWQTPRNARTLRAFMALQNQDIGRRIADLRKAKGNPPQTLVAEALGVGERTYQSWEQGDAKPGYKNLQALADYYGVGEEYILTGTHPPDNTPDLMGELDGDRLARIEKRLAEAEDDRREMRQLIAEMGERIDQQNENLDRQSGILERIEDAVRALGIPAGTNLQEHLAQQLRDVAARAAQSSSRERTASKDRPQASP